MFQVFTMQVILTVNLFLNHLFFQVFYQFLLCLSIRSIYALLISFNLVVSHLYIKLFHKNIFINITVLLRDYISLFIIIFNYLFFEFWIVFFIEIFEFKWFIFIGSNTLTHKIFVQVLIIYWGILSIDIIISVWSYYTLRRLWIFTVLIVVFTFFFHFGIEFQIILLQI